MQNKRRIGVYLLKHYAGMALLMLLLAFFLVPFRVLLDCVRNAEMIRAFGGNPGLLVQDMGRHFSSLLNLAGSQELLSLAFAAMGYFSGIFLFRHLFSGKRTVLEAGLPVKKGTDFLLRSLVYGIDSLLPVILSLALVPVLAGVAGTGGFLSADVFRQCMVLALMHLYGYAVGALSAVMTGQLWACAAVTLTLSAGMEGMLYCWQDIAVHYLFTMPLDAARTWMSTWSPAFSLYKALLRPQAFAPTAGIAATAVFLVLAFVLYRKRAAERTGHSVAFAGLELPGMILASLGSGTLCGMIFMNIIDSEAALLVSLVLGAVLGYMLFRGLILLNMKKAFTFVPLGVACAVVLAAGVFALRFDLAGYDRYVPEAGRLGGASRQHGQDVVTVVCAQEIADLLQAPSGLRQVRRADDDQKLRVVQGVGDGVREAGGGGQFILVAENDAQLSAANPVLEFFGNLIVFYPFLNAHGSFPVERQVPVADKGNIGTLRAFFCGSGGLVQIHGYETEPRGPLLFPQYGVERLF